MDKVIREYSSHSVDSMRAESDALLKTVSAFPFTEAEAARILWLCERLPKLLADLALKNACFLGCPKRTEAPSKEDLQALIMPSGSRDNPLLSPVVLKDRILAYIHGLSELRVRDYLTGYRPKTNSRAQR